MYCPLPLRSARPATSEFAPFFARFAHPPGQPHRWFCARNDAFLPDRSSPLSFRCPQFPNSPRSSALNRLPTEKHSIPCSPSQAIDRCIGIPSQTGATRFTRRRAHPCTNRDFPLGNKEPYARQSRNGPTKLQNWLGGLDSNQDSQSQSLESCQLDDLPPGGNKKESQHFRISRQPRFSLSRLIGNVTCVNQSALIHSIKSPNPPHDFHHAPVLSLATIRPSRMVNSSPPQVIRFDAKLASHTRK